MLFQPMPPQWIPGIGKDMERLPGINDILDYQHIPSCQVFDAITIEFYLARISMSS